MRQSLVFLWCFICAYSLSAQFSASYSYNINSTDWQDQYAETHADHDVFLTTHEAGLAYWFKLKQKRVEFHPGVIYGTSSTNDESGANIADWQSFYLSVPIQIYPMDLEGDCNCPTFSKDGGFIKKGFFVFIAPEAGYHMLDGRIPETGLASEIWISILEFARVLV